MPDEWKLSDTVPLPKTKPPKSIESDLRPISITSVAAKAVEYFPVKSMQRKIMGTLDPNQFGGIQRSSTDMALISIIDHILKSTDNSSTSVRMLLCDFSKAFDLVDHNILIDKLSSKGIHESLTRWAANFLQHRTQRVKIGSTISSVKSMNAGCPQGTLLGPLAFVSYIDDLRLPGDLQVYKYVDDTTVLQACSSDGDNRQFQLGIEQLNTWAIQNKMRFNTAKTKEIIFDFRKNQTPPPKLTMNGSKIERVSEAKILGVIIRSDLKWNSHVSAIVKKANKRLYLLRLCKRAGLEASELIKIYTSLVRSVLEYCSIVFHASLPQYLSDELERVQKRAMALIFPSLNYEDSLESAKLASLYSRREEQCKKMFLALSKRDHKLHGLMPKTRTITHNLRNAHKIPQIRTKTQRYFRSFVPYCIRQFG